MAIFSKVGIVGTGLIGGSLGLALKKTGCCRSIVGISRQAGSIKTALRTGAIDKGSLSFDILRGCDLVILAAPVETILEQIAQVKKHAPSGCIVIDVASTKEAVVAKAHKAFARFVGCHPLAGSEKRGIDHARADLFNNATCIITPLGATDAAALAVVRKMWKRLGARISIMDPAKHDRCLAFVSHLPHIIAFALMNAVPQKYLSDAPQSFRDMTRIAGSSPDLWDDICSTNRRNLIVSLGSFVKQADSMLASLKSRDIAGMKRLMAKAQKKKKLLL